MKAVVALWLEVVEVSWAPGFSYICCRSWKHSSLSGCTRARSPPAVVCGMAGLEAVVLRSLTRAGMEPERHVKTTSEGACMIVLPCLQVTSKLHKCQLGHGDIKSANFLKESTATPVQAIDLQAVVQLDTRECAAWHDIISESCWGCRQLPERTFCGRTPVAVEEPVLQKAAEGPVQAQTKKRL